MPLTRVSYNFDCPVIMLFILPESCATRRGGDTQQKPVLALRRGHRSPPRRGGTGNKL